MIKIANFATFGAFKKVFFLDGKIKKSVIVMDGNAAFHLTSSLKKRVFFRAISGACSCTVEICLP